MMQHEITKRTELLTGDGRLAEPGWAKRMNFIYNREKAKKTPFNLKEWNFYQFLKDHWVVQLTIGHVSYMCSVTVTLLDLNTGEKREVNRMKPFFIPRLDADPEDSGISEFRDRDFLMRFETTHDKRLLLFRGKSRVWGDAEVCLNVENDRANPKMVIATPFDKPHQFYLNYKENYYTAVGFARFGDLQVDLSGSAGLLDWGRGIWPYRHEWYWGNLTAQVKGKDFGLNIGWGFGDLSHATENVYFYDHKVYKVGTLNIEGECPTASCCLRDEEGKLELRFSPAYDNYTRNKLLIVNTYCHQVYGLFDGWVMTDDGKLELYGIPAFIEHAVNRW